jgi:membrane protein YqaA with SNARE-associated domain
MSEAAAIFSLFISSLLGATLLPGGSEAVLYTVLQNFPESQWIALGAATLGNTLGGMISYWMGWMLPQTQQLKHVDKLRRFGTPALLLAWAPLVGDALCLSAGWLRLNPWHCALFMATGKFARYWLIAAF